LPPSDPGLSFVADRPPRMNERYQIKERIGHGGLGEVFIALDTQLQREVALKRMKAAEGQSPDDLIKEAKVLSALQHPNILTVFDLGQDEQGAFVITELLRGETLEQVIARGPLRYEDFRQMALQSLEGLVAAQALNLIHRDLKPANLMVIWHASGKFQVKILDFGLAKISQQASRQTEDQQAGIMGSIFYMAPEQFERQPLDGRTDLYALGSIFYFSLTGKNPFDGDTAPVVMAAHLTHRVTPLIQVRPDLPPWVCDWVMWFINRDPADRPASAQEAMEAFQQQAAAWDAAVQAAPLAAAAARASAPPASEVVLLPGRSARDALRATARTQGVRRRTSSVPVHRAKRSWVVFALPTLLAAAALYGLWQWKRAQDAARGLDSGDVGLTIDSIKFPDSQGATVPVKGIPVGAGTTPLPLSQANIVGGTHIRRRTSINALGSWSDPDTRVTWDIAVTEPGNYEVLVMQSLDDARMGGKYEVRVAGQTLAAEARPSPSKNQFIEVPVGIVKLAKGGATVELQPTSITATSLMNLGGVAMRKR
jgi:Protein kinase domain